jgi:hypothetical protein
MMETFRSDKCFFRCISLSNQTRKAYRNGRAEEEERGQEAAKVSLPPAVGLDLGLAHEEPDDPGDTVSGPGGDQGRDDGKELVEELQ